MSAVMSPDDQEPDVRQLFDLTGQVALVTGAAGHLGASLARALAEVGARVIATSRDLGRAEQAAAALPNESSAEHFGVALDHASSDSIDQCIETALQRAGKIDILVNNAHEVTTRSWKDVTAPEFNRQLANSTAYFLLARHVRNEAVNRNSPASIILIGSMYGLVGSYPDVYDGLGPESPVAYHALKGGILHLTRHLAVYWARDGVRVNCLSPGPFPRDTARPELLQRLADKSPMARTGHPYELKGALVLLASRAGSYITGQNVVVDGGWTAW
jgi:NAD(P)-dependent dehydrogenase (short-subunit alcohol dehydrogenase family)